MDKVLNRNLNLAKASKKDEFYTQLTDIQRELAHYAPHFRGKVVYCNCDDPRTSNFFRYFQAHFERLGLKRLIATCHADGVDTPVALHAEYAGGPDAPQVARLKGDGDFRSGECVQLLKEADIVVTNPPFSLFREYVDLLMEQGKHFLVIGHQNAIVYRNIFQYVKENRIWLGTNNGGTKWFEVKDHYDIITESRKKEENGRKYFSMGSIVWFTNLDIGKRHQDLVLTKRYALKTYPKYDNYDAIEVSRVADIPLDFDGVMGVPITFLDKYNPEQFEIVGSNRGINQEPTGTYGRGSFVGGKETFKRLFIRHRRLRAKAGRAGEEPDWNYWKDRYKDSWGKAAEKERMVIRLIEEHTGKRVQLFGLGAGSTGYLQGRAADHDAAKGDADLYIPEADVFVEVTGPNIKVDPKDALWIRPDKITNALEKARNGIGKGHYVVHVIDRKDAPGTLVRALPITPELLRFPTINPKIRGAVETYREIPATYSGLLSFEEFLKRITG